MTVYDNREVEVCPFEQLEDGDPFEFGNMLLMKMTVLHPSDNHVYNAVCLLNGMPYFIEDYHAVHPANAHVCIESA